MSDQRQLTLIAASIAAAGALVLGGCSTNSMLTADAGLDDSLAEMDIRPIGPQAFMLGAGDALGAELGRVYFVHRQMELDGVRMAAPDPGRAFQE